MKRSNVIEVEPNDERLQLLSHIIRRELDCTTSPHKSKPAIRCPYCNNSSPSKRGRDAYGKQRYQCSICQRSFTISSRSELSSTNLSLETWLLFAECHVEHLALRESALRCNVSLKTALFMRKRLERTISRYSRQVKQQLAKSLQRV